MYTFARRNRVSPGCVVLSNFRAPVRLVTDQIVTHRTRKETNGVGLVSVAAFADHGRIGSEMKSLFVNLRRLGTLE